MKQKVILAIVSCLMVFVGGYLIGDLRIAIGLTLLLWGNNIGLKL